MNLNNTALHIISYLCIISCNVYLNIEGGRFAQSRTDLCIM